LGSTGSGAGAGADAVPEDKRDDAVAESDSDKDSADPAEGLLAAGSGGAAVSVAASSAGFSSWDGVGSSCLRN
jgi:hypothetical protein